MLLSCGALRGDGVCCAVLCCADERQFMKDGVLVLGTGRPNMYWEVPVHFVTALTAPVVKGKTMLRLSDTKRAL